MNPKDLIGKKFKLSSKYGISDWTDEIVRVDNTVYRSHIIITETARSTCYPLKEKRVLDNPINKWVIVGKKCGQKYLYNEIIIQNE